MRLDTLEEKREFLIDVENLLYAYDPDTVAEKMNLPFKNLYEKVRRLDPKLARKLYKERTRYQECA